MNPFPEKYVEKHITRDDFGGKKEEKFEVSFPYNKNVNNKIRGVRYSCGCTSADIKEDSILATIKVMNSPSIPQKTVLLTVTMEDGTSHKLNATIKIS